jgi:diacylglycerol kinase (ATP)
LSQRQFAPRGLQVDNPGLYSRLASSMSDTTELISEFKSKSGFKRVFNAARYSIAGLLTAVKSEHAFRQELAVVLPAAILALLLPVSRLEKLLLIAVLVLVLIVELLNSAIEAAIDRISLDRHPLSKNAKDFGSAAVALAVVLAALTWVVLLYPLLGL